MRIKNTTGDRSKTHLHRKSPGFNETPSFAGRRLYQGQTMEITPAQYEQQKELLDSWVAKGMIEIDDGPVAMREPELDADGKKLGGPTLEEFMERGYKPENYPPVGWAVVPSPGLTAYEAQKKEELLAEMKKKEEEELAFLIAEEEKAAKAAVEAKAAADAAAAPTTTESAGTSVEPPAAPSAPAVQDDKSDSKKTGKKKLV